MDEQYLREAATPLIALARISQQIEAAGSVALSNGASLLLEQMLSLCSAQRGALLLPRRPSIAHVVTSLLAPTVVEGVRILAKIGVSEEDIQPLLMAFGSAGPDVRTHAEAPGWLLCRIPLTAASARQAEPSSLAHVPLDALLVLGWHVTEHDPSFDALERGLRLLPLVADVAGVMLTNLLLVERLHEDETTLKQQARREREVFPTELLANVSHELRSPLTSIKGYTETLLRLDRRTSRQQRCEFLLTIKAACDEQAMVIDRLLEMAQLDAGTVRIERSLVNLARLVREAFAAAQQGFSAVARRQSTPEEQGPFTFTLHLRDLQGQPTSAEPLIQADRSRLQEVLEHLLSNAILYSPRGGSIDVMIQPMTVQGLAERLHISQLAANLGKTGNLPPLRVWESQQGVELCVRDQGMGIAPEHLERIFERFYRLDTSLTRPVNGLGLGLSICKRIIELHDGILWAESAVGHGSVFHVWLPTTVEMQSDLPL